MKLKHFDGVPAVLAYVTSELLDTLRDDLSKQEGDESEHYTDEDRQEMRDRIADIESISPVVESVPELLETVEALYTWIEGNVACGLPEDIAKGVNALIAKAKG